MSTDTKRPGPAALGDRARHILHLVLLSEEQTSLRLLRDGGSCYVSANFKLFEFSKTGI